MNTEHWKAYNHPQLMLVLAKSKLLLIKNCFQMQRELDPAEVRFVCTRL